MYLLAFLVIARTVLPHMCSLLVSRLPGVVIDIEPGVVLKKRSWC
jgi:hypothetical protein